MNMRRENIIMENKEFIKLPDRVIRRELIKEVVIDDNYYVDFNKKSTKVSIKTFEDEYNYYNEKGIEVYEDILNQLGFGETDKINGETIETGVDYKNILEEIIKTLKDKIEFYKDSSNYCIGSENVASITSSLSAYKDILNMIKVKHLEYGIKIEKEKADE